MTARALDLEAAVREAKTSPSDLGSVDLIAVRPAELERMLPNRVELSVHNGVEGDNWLERERERAAVVGEVRFDNQVTLMNSRFADAVTPENKGWEIAGDQFYVDYDLSMDNMPPGSRLRVGNAVIEISATPHTGCAKFSRRFGRDVLMATRTEEGKRLRLRGVNARVVSPGVVAVGDSVRRVRLDD